MNKNVIRAVAAAVAVGAVYTGTSWWLGQRVEAQYTSLLDRVATQLGPDKIAERRYERGVFGAQSTVVLAFRVPDDDEAAPQAQDSQDAQDASAPKPAAAAGTQRMVRFTLQDDIRHGPLAGWRPGAARVHTRLVSVEGLDDDMRQLFAKVSAPEFVTYVGFGGDYDGQMRLPAGELIDPKRPETQTRWQAMEYDYRLSADKTQLSGAIRWPQLSVQLEVPQDPDEVDEDVAADASTPQPATQAPGTTLTHFEMQGMDMRFDYRQLADQWLMAPGKSDGKIESLVVTHRASPQTALKPAFALKAVRFDSETVEASGQLSSVVRAVSQGSLGSTEFKEWRYENRMARMDGQALAAAQKMLMALFTADGQAAPPNADETLAMVSRWMDAKPEFSDRYTVTAMDGQVGEFGYTVSLSEALPQSEQRLLSGLPWSFQLLQRLKLNADLRLPRSFLPALAELVNDPDLTADQLAQAAGNFTTRGWLREEAGVWLGKLEYGQGQLLLSGKPFSLQDLMSDDDAATEEGEDGEEDAAEEAPAAAPAR